MKPHTTEVSGCLAESLFEPKCNGIMGVPITFMDKYNPEQFEIVGFGSGNFGIEIGVTGYKEEYLDKMGSTIPIKGNLYYVTNGTPVTPYKRILIRFKKGDNSR